MWLPALKISLFSLAVLAGAGPVGCDQKGNAAPTAPPAAPVMVELALVQRRPVNRAIDVTGTLHGEEETVISSKLSGRVSQVLKDVGDPVQRGGTLAQIEPTDYELTLRERKASLAASLAKVGLNEVPGDELDIEQLPTVQRARAEADNAQSRYQRARQLFEQAPPVISEQDNADVRTTWEVAARNAEVELLNVRAFIAEARTSAAAVAIAEQRLADTAVRTPGSQGEQGPSYVVAERLVSLGEYVNAGTQMFRLVASGLIKFRADVPERYAGQLQIGQEARVWVEAYADPVFGKVARVSPQIDRSNRMFNIEVHVPNTDGRLKPGAFARGSVVTRVEESVPFVPVNAVVTFAGVQKVFSVKDGKAVEHRVQLGVREEGLIEVIGDFAVSEVVTAGAGGLAPGVGVTVTVR